MCIGRLMLPDLAKGYLKAAHADSFCDDLCDNLRTYTSK
jgi:hypothetical protein